MTDKSNPVDLAGAVSLDAAACSPADSRSLDAVDAARYRWLRQQHWDEAEIACVKNPKAAVKLGHDCPSLERLDAAIDAAMPHHSEAPPPLAAPVQPTGFKLVPTEPTQLMVEAGANEVREYNLDAGELQQSARSAYQSMLAAAPVPQAVQGHEQDVQALTDEAKRLTQFITRVSTEASAAKACEAIDRAVVAAAAVPAGVVDALRELVAVKRLKEEMRTVRSDPYYTTHADYLEAEYKRRQPIAWDSARAALREHLTGKP